MEETGGLESALCRMAQGRVDYGVLQETKLTNGVYTREASRFWVMTKEAPSSHRGGVAISYCKAEHFAIEELHLHGPIVIRFHLVTGRWPWYVVGCYITPSDASTIEDFAASIRY